MTLITVGTGGDYPAPWDAARIVQPGDVVRILPGVYRGRLVCGTPGVTWQGEAGAVIDGGYSHEWARKSGDSWENLIYRAPTAEMGNVVTVNADGVTLRGLAIRNAGNAGISAGAVRGLSIQGCRIDHCYDSCIRINGGAGWAEDVVIEGNTCTNGSVKKFDPTRKQDGGPQAVSGVVKVGRTRRGRIISNRVIGGHGEGINCGKDIVEFEVSRNFIARTAHKMIYCNHATNGLIAENVLYNDGHLAYLYTDGEAPAALACVDEDARGTFTPSDNLRWERNVVFNCGIPFQLEPRRDDASLVFERNTFAWGPLTRRGPVIVRGDVALTGNLFAGTPGGPMPEGRPDEVRPNAWTRQPPLEWRTADDVIDEAAGPVGNPPRPEFDPFGLEHDLDEMAVVRLLRPAHDGPLVRDGAAVFGALEPLYVEPPDDDDEPPVTGPVDVAALRAAVASVRHRLAAAEGWLDEIERILDAA